MTPEEFLKAVRGGNVPGFTNIWTLPDKASHFFPNTDEGRQAAVKCALAAAADKQVYFNCGSLRSRLERGRRGTAADVGSIGCLWLDVDYGPGHEKPRPPDQAAAEQLIRLIAPGPPSIVVHSGGGLHCYWLLRAPLVFDDNRQRKAVQRIAEAWRDAAKAIWRERGWTLDSTADLARLLRVPGTWHRKDPKNVRPVEILSVDLAKRYDLDEFNVAPASAPLLGARAAVADRDATAEPIARNRPAGTQRFVLRDTAQPPKHKLDALLENDVKFKRTWERTRTDLTDQSASSYDMALADAATAAGWTDQEVADLIIAWRREHDEDVKKAQRPDYIARTLKKARAGQVGSGGDGDKPPTVAQPGEGVGPAAAAACLPLGTRDPATGKLILSTTRTLPTALAYVREFCTHTAGGTLHSYAGMLLRWQGNRFAEVEDAGIKHQLQPWLHDATCYVYNRQAKQMEVKPFPANPTTLKAALESIRTFTHLPADLTPPCWLGEAGDRRDPRDVLACTTLNVHIPTGTVLPATPALFNTNALDFDFDPAAAAPARWLAFLEELWGSDAESMRLLQEWFGYCLTGDTRQQKMLLLLGPRRCGKGTIGRVLTRLVGAGNVAGPTTSSLAGPFGLQPLIGKSLAVVSDARFSGHDIAVVTERLLCISGEDTLTVDRKYASSVTLRLPTRFMFLTNELPRAQDASGALAGRFLVLRFTKTFFGREDIALTAKLLTELPGILRWALEGWRGLRARGRFVQPTGVEDAIGDLEDLFSPVGAFVREYCAVGPGRSVEAGQLFAAWQAYCRAIGRTNTGTVQTFARDLRAVLPELRVRQPRGAGGRERWYEGLALADQEGSQEGADSDE